MIHHSWFGLFQTTNTSTTLLLTISPSSSCYHNYTCALLLLLMHLLNNINNKWVETCNAGALIALEHSLVARYHIRQPSPQIFAVFHALIGLFVLIHFPNLVLIKLNVRTLSVLGSYILPFLENGNPNPNPYPNP